MTLDPGCNKRLSIPSEETRLERTRIVCLEAGTLRSLANAEI